VRDNAKKKRYRGQKGENNFFSPFRRLVSFFQLTSMYTTPLWKKVEFWSNKKKSEPVGQNEPHLKERGKKRSPPYGPRGNHGCPPEPREKSIKNYYSFPPSAKNVLFFLSTTII